MRPVVRSGAIACACTTAAAGALGIFAAVHGLAGAGAAGTFTLAGLCVGAIGVGAWVAGQVFPRAGATLGIALAGVAAASLLVDHAASLTPWGWAGSAYPVDGSPLLALIALAALALATLCCVPPLMNRLDTPRLMAQSVRRDTASTYVVCLDLSGASELYQQRPRTGRGLHVARRHLPLAVTFFLRGVIGACRTPFRLAMGASTLTGVGVALTVALPAGRAAVVLGAVLGLIVFAAVGPLTDGIRHASRAAGHFPMYGTSDAALVAMHCGFPAVTTSALLAAGAWAAATTTSAAALPGILAAVSAGVLALAARVCESLKGPLPPSLLSPSPTPMGDASVLIRLGWALDGPILAAVSGAAAAFSPTAPGVLAVPAVILTGTIAHRWGQRR